MTMQELFDKFRGKPHSAIPSPKTTRAKPKQAPTTKNTLSPTAIPFRMRPSTPHPHHRRSPRADRLSVSKAPINKTPISKTPINKTSVTPIQTPQAKQMNAWTMFYA